MNTSPLTGTLPLRPEPVKVEVFLTDLDHLLDHVHYELRRVRLMLQLAVDARAAPDRSMLLDAAGDALQPALVELTHTLRKLRPTR